MTSLRCSECDWMGGDFDTLRAISPFDQSETLIGCPVCKDVNTMHALCDEPGCSRDYTCGTSTASGYRRVCGEHFRKIEADKAKASSA